MSGAILWTILARYSHHPPRAWAFSALVGLAVGAVFFVSGLVAKFFVDKHK
jgi:hypothetical protein